MTSLESSVVLYSDIARDPATLNTSLVFNLNAIQQSLDNLFKTSVGTRAWQPTYGHYFEQLIGEPMCETTAESLLFKAAEAVQRWEPRVSLDLKNSVATPTYEQHTYNLVLVFTVKGMASQDKFSYSTKISITGGIS